MDAVRGYASSAAVVRERDRERERERVAPIAKMEFRVSVPDLRQTLDSTTRVDVRIDGRVWRWSFGVLCNGFIHRLGCIAVFIKPHYTQEEFAYGWKCRARVQVLLENRVDVARSITRTGIFQLEEGKPVLFEDFLSRKMAKETVLMSGVNEFVKVATDYGANNVVDFVVSISILQASGCHVYRRLGHFSLGETGWCPVIGFTVTTLPMALALFMLEPTRSAIAESSLPTIRRFFRLLMVAQDAVTFPGCPPGEENLLMSQAKAVEIEIGVVNVDMTGFKSLYEALHEEWELFSPCHLLCFSLEGQLDECLVVDGALAPHSLYGVCQRAGLVWTIFFRDGSDCWFQFDEGRVMRSTKAAALRNQSRSRMVFFLAESLMPLVKPPLRPLTVSDVDPEVASDPSLSYGVRVLMGGKSTARLGGPGFPLLPAREFHVLAHMPMRDFVSKSVLPLFPIIPADCVLHVRLLAPRYEGGGLRFEEEDLCESPLAVAHFLRQARTRRGAGAYESLHLFAFVLPPPTATQMVMLLKYWDGSFLHYKGLVVVDKSWSSETPAFRVLARKQVSDLCPRNIRRPLVFCCERGKGDFSSPKLKEGEIIVAALNFNIKSFAANAESAKIRAPPGVIEEEEERDSDDSLSLSAPSSPSNDSSFPSLIGCSSSSSNNGSSSDDEERAFSRTNQETHTDDAPSLGFASQGSDDASDDGSAGPPPLFEEASDDSMPSLVSDSEGSMMPWHQRSAPAAQDKVKSLEGLGFSREACTEALAYTCGNLDAAADRLLSSEPSGSSSPLNSSRKNSTVEATERVASALQDDEYVSSLFGPDVDMEDEAIQRALREIRDQTSNTTDNE